MLLTLCLHFVLHILLWQICVTGCTVFLHVHFSRFSSIPRACPRLSSSIAWKDAYPVVERTTPGLCTHAAYFFVFACLPACCSIVHDIAFLERLLLCTLRTSRSSKIFVPLAALVFCGRRWSGTREVSEKVPPSVNRTSTVGNRNRLNFTDVVSHDSFGNSSLRLMDALLHFLFVVPRTWLS